MLKWLIAEALRSRTLLIRNNVTEGKANPAENEDGNQHETHPIKNPSARTPPFARLGDFGLEFAS
jgi:hypothetical protein